MMDSAELRVGQWVEYRTDYKTEIGRIKSWNANFVFVVYKCAGEWDNFMNYTGCATNIKDLHTIGDRPT